ncbi:hypothetical protein MRX96_022639 [Rhipicephalus microplus]
MHSPKYSSKKSSAHNEPPDKKVTISSNMTAKSSVQSSKEDQLPHEMKLPSCPVMMPTPNSDESPSEEDVLAYDPAGLVDHTLYLHVYIKPQPNLQVNDPSVIQIK